MNEEWKDIPTWEGIFQVSNFGRIKGKSYLKPYRRKNGYYTVSLRSKGKKEEWLIHRLVASVWFRPLEKNEVIHHKNHLKCCNCISNLQIMNVSEHAHNHNLGNKRALGKKHSEESKMKNREARYRYLSKKQSQGGL